MERGSRERVSGVRLERERDCEEDGEEGRGEEERRRKRRRKKCKE